MEKYKITQKDTREISKLITGIVGREFGVSYECNLWVQPKANQPHTDIYDTILVSSLRGEYYEDIMDEDGALDCTTYHYKKQLQDNTYVSIKRNNGEWAVHNVV